MAICPKHADAIEKMREAGRTVAKVLTRIGAMLAPGVTTGELDDEAARICRERGARPLFLGQPHPRGGTAYPGCICASLNEELVHGIPGPRKIVDGDVVSIDFGVEQGGWCADAARTWAVGDVAPKVGRLLAVTEQALALVRCEARAGVLWSAVAGRIEALVTREGFSIVTDYVGHGIGRKMWEPPQVPNYVSRALLKNDWMLVQNMTLAVEPMVNAGGRRVREAADGWTVVTADGSPCAHFEDTFVVHKDGAEPLTRLEGEPGGSSEAHG